MRFLQFFVTDAGTLKELSESHCVKADPPIDLSWLFGLGVTFESP